MTSPQLFYVSPYFVDIQVFINLRMCLIKKGLRKLRLLKKGDYIQYGSLLENKKAFIIGFQTSVISAFNFVTVFFVVYMRHFLTYTGSS